MSGFAVALVLALAQSTARDASPTETILLLQSEAAGVDRQRLLEAVTIYTRDLGVSVAEGPEAPRTVSADELARMRGLRARMAFWCRRAAGEPRVELHALWFTSDGHGAETVSFPADESQDLYRAVGLKLRSLLATQAASRAPERASTPPRQPPPPAPTAETATPPRPAAAAVTAAGRWLAAVGYAWLPAIEEAPSRHGLTLQAALLRPPGFELWVGADVTTRPTASLEHGTATLVDVPARAGARVHPLGPGSLQLAVGPAVALHFLSVSAVSFDDRASGRVFRLAAGLGLDVVGRVTFGPDIALEARVWLEVFPARTRFVLHGMPALETGRLTGGLGLGVAFLP